MSKNKIILWGPAVIFFGILLAVLLVQFGLYGKNTASLTLTNQTDLELSEVIVVLYNDPCVIQRLAPGESSSCLFEIKFDSHFKITWMESGANSFAEEIGYVTRGINFKHNLEFLGGGKVSFKTNETS